VGLTAVALGLRLVALASVPALLAGDEAAMGLEGQKVLAGALRNWFGTGWFSHPSLYFVLLAASQRLLGYSVTALRVTSALAGALTVPGLYVAVRRWCSVRVALIAAALLTTYHFHLHYSRLGLNNVWDALFLVWTLYWLDRALEERQVWPWACLGMVLGLAQYGYWGSRALPLVVLGVVVREVAGGGKARASLGWGWLGAAATLGLTTAPLAFHFVAHPDEWSFRFAQISILRSGWLAETAARDGVSALQVLAQHAVRSVLAFHYYTDTSVLYGAPIPLLDYFMAVLAVFGAVTLIRGANVRAMLSVALSLVLALVFGAMLLADPPASQRLVILSPLVCLLAALGLDRLLSLAHNCFAVSRTLSTILLLVVLLAIGWGNVRYYFQVYTPGGYFLESNSELVDSAGRYLRNLDREISVFWAGAPRVYADAPTLLYLAPRARVQDVAEFHWGLGENLPCPPAVFVFVPERVAELEGWRGRCPGGSVVEFYGQDQTLLFVAYELP
jgi:4-amino-4-deoxy-L-arabinose transferase-like glycosyltransferase